MFIEKEAWIVWNSDKLQDVVKSQGVPSETHKLCVDVAYICSLANVLPLLLLFNSCK
jgi:hypothetical protein